MTDKEIVQQAKDGAAKARGFQDYKDILRKVPGINLYSEILRRAIEITREHPTKWYSPDENPPKLEDYHCSITVLVYTPNNTEKVQEAWKSFTYKNRWVSDKHEGTIHVAAWTFKPQPPK